MKKLPISICVILALALFSCESNGPKGQIEIPDRSIDEIFDDVVDGDGWAYLYNKELYYKQDGEWISAGMHRAYDNLADDDGCDIWIDFDGFRSPAEYCEDYGYSYRVQYKGIWFYF